MEDKEIDKLYELIDSGEYDKAKSALTEIIKNDEKAKLQASISATPKHLT